MASNISWRKARSIMDIALQAQTGIQLDLDSWARAEADRAIMYKVRHQSRVQSRKMYPDPEDPNHGVSPYDVLGFWIASSVSRREMEVTFLETGDTVNLADFPEPACYADESADPFGPQPVVLRIPGVVVTQAPSFQVAWEIARRDFPATLTIENGEDLSYLNIREI